MSAPKRILFPVDFSPSCRLTAPAVAAWTRKFEAELTLLHSFEFPPEFANASEPECAAARARIHQHLQTFASETFPGPRPRLALLQGKPAAMIVLHAAEHEADLIMMPSRGETTYRALLMGSVTLGVLHDAECPVWTTAHADSPTMPTDCRRIVCAIDMEKHTVATLRWANEIKKQFSAELFVVHSVPEVDPRFASAAAERAHSHLVWNARQGYPAIAAQAGVSEPLEVLQTPGVTASITSAAASHNADLLVVGRGSVQGFLGRLRTNAHEIIRTSPCPVLSV